MPHMKSIARLCKMDIPVKLLVMPLLWAPEYEFKGFPFNSIVFFPWGNTVIKKSFSLYEIEQFIREAGAEKVTEDAVLRLEEEIEKLAEQMTERSRVYAQHAGRKTIKADDVRLIFDGSGFVHQSNPANLSPNPKSTNITSTADR
jgi:histone H3/H4